MSVKIAVPGHKVDIVVGGLWHAPQLAEGLFRAGYSTRLITAFKAHVPGVNVLRIPLMCYPLKAVRGFRKRDATVFRTFGAVAYRYLREDSTVIAWSSFGLSAMKHRRRVIIVRGSKHITRQREILAQIAKETGVHVPMPNKYQEALERNEYRQATYVSVPTSQIAADPLWRNDGAVMNISAYGFPEMRQVPISCRAPGRIIFAGQIGYQKGIDLLISPLRKRSPEIQQFLLFGNPAPGFPLNTLPDWWTLCGWISPEQLRDEMVRSIGLILLSRSEGMARVGLEALACGTPIIVSPETGLDAWLTDGGGAVVDPKDPEAVRQSIHEVLHNWKDHSARALEIAQSWSWTDHARKVMEGCEG